METMRVEYRGEVDFTTDFPWDVQQEENLQKWLQEGLEIVKPFDRNTVEQHLLQLYCRDTVVDYLDLLAGHLLEEIDAYVFLDARNFHDLLHLALLLSTEKFRHLRVAMIGSALPPQGMGWEDTYGPLGYLGRSVAGVEALAAYAVAICLPPFSLANLKKCEVLRQAFEKLSHQGTPFRIIPETELTREWDGLDYLVVSPDTMSLQGRRKLMGFCAAGGTVVNIGEPLGLPYEISFDEWRID